MTYRAHRKVSKHKLMTRGMGLRTNTVPERHSTAREGELVPVMGHETRRPAAGEWGGVVITGPAYFARKR